MSILQGDPAAARPWLARAAATARETRQSTQLSESLSIAANAESQIGNPTGASGLLDEAEAIIGGCDDYAATIELVQARAVHAFFASDLETAAATSSEGIRLSRETGDLFYLASMLRNFAATVSYTHLNVLANSRNDHLGLSATASRRSSSVSAKMRMKNPPTAQGTRNMASWLPVNSLTSKVAITDAIGMQTPMTPETRPR